MNFLDKAAILGIEPRIERVQVNGWGGFVFVRQLGIADRLQFEADFSAKPNDRSNWVRLGQMTICDEKGELLFSPEDVPALCDRPGEEFEEILERTMRLNGFMPPEAKAEKKGS